MQEDDEEPNSKGMVNLQSMLGTRKNSETALGEAEELPSPKSHSEVNGE